MFVHAVKNDIPNKLLWILILVAANLIGGLIYYFAVFQRLKRKNSSELIKRTFILGAVVLVIITFVTLLTLPAVPVNKVEEIPLNKVVDYSIRREIKRIEIRGDELLITKKGETTPSLRSEKPAGSSLRDHGINLEDVEIMVSR